MKTSHSTPTAAVDFVNITIDGNRIRVRKGRTVLEAAKEAGIYIPAVCSRPDLCPFTCNLCIVAIEGIEGYPLACATPVTEEMVILTETPRLRILRKKHLRRILAIHPAACLECQRLEPCDGSVCGRKVPYQERCVGCKDNERCDLQTAARYILREDILLPFRKKEFEGSELEPSDKRKVQTKVREDGYPDQSTVLLGGG
jgi:predicted molibdopterin-dependent oxidoreductase YjgC